MNGSVLTSIEPAVGFAACPVQPRSLLRRCGRTLLKWIEHSRQRQALAVLERHLLDCQSALERDPGSAFNRDPL